VVPASARRAADFKAVMRRLRLGKLIDTLPERVALFPVSAAWHRSWVPSRSIDFGHKTRCRVRRDAVVRKLA
jgi:hypothetical protein